MPRRRVTLRTYLRRRWRVVGFLAVLFLSAVLVLTLTDRGHDPLWSERAPLVDQIAVSPSGREVYILVKEDENGPVVRLEAHDGASGTTLWKTDMNNSHTLISADDSGVAIATGFPRAFATYYGRDGDLRFQMALEGTPRALAVENERVVVALQSGGQGDRVLVVEEGALVRTHGFGGYVNALDLRAQRLAVGTSMGGVVVFASNGSELHNDTLDISVLSLRLSANGHALIAGGYNRSVSAAFSGGVAFFDYTSEPPLQWVQATRVGVGLVDLDSTGEWAIAVEESMPRHRFHAYETGAGVERWGKVLPGLVWRDDAGRGGAGVSPDGAIVVVGTLRGDLRVYDAATGARLWSYASEGTTAIAFRETTPPQFAANARLVPNGPLDGLLYFSTGREPLSDTVGAVAAMIGLILVGMGLVVLGVGYWRLRRSL